MDPWASVVDRIMHFAESAKRFLQGDRTDPIEILKRLQRQAFFDIMKLRERQEKVERVLSLYSSNKGSPFTESSTHVKGLINVGGAFLLNHNQKRHTASDSAEMNTVIDSRFIFETTVRQKDSLLVELVTDHKYIYQENDYMGSPLVLAKLMYTANIDDLLSVVSVPVGARPPLLIKRHNYAAGVIFKFKNIAFSLAELVSARGKPTDAGHAVRFLSTFGQISCQAVGQTRLTVSGVWHGPNPFSWPIKSDTTTARETIPGGCMHMELEIDEDSKIGGWIEVLRSNPRSLNWAISLSDSPQDELGWGASVRGRVEGQSKQVQLETFLNFSLGKKATLQPGVACTVDGRKCTPALVFRTSWFL